MFGKGGQTRVTEIIDYLCNEVPGPERPGVRAFLNQQAVMATAMSDQYSSKLVQNPGTADERAMRRAILFLDSLNGATPAELQQLRNIAAAQLRAQLDRRLLGLRYAADQEQGGTGVLGFVFNNKFKPDALNFLANNNVFVYGSNTSGVVDCFFEYVWKYGQFKIIPPPSGKAHSCARKAVNVPAIPLGLGAEPTRAWIQLCRHCGDRTNRGRSVDFDAVHGVCFLFQGGRGTALRSSHHARQRTGGGDPRVRNRISPPTRRSDRGRYRRRFFERAKGGDLQGVWAWVLEHRGASHRIRLHGAAFFDDDHWGPARQLANLFPGSQRDQTIVGLSDSVT
jgi:hypothetical protein